MQMSGRSRCCPYETKRLHQLMDWIANDSSKQSGDSAPGRETVGGANSRMADQDPLFPPLLHLKRSSFIFLEDLI